MTRLRSQSLRSRSQRAAESKLGGAAPEPTCFNSAWGLGQKSPQPSQQTCVGQTVRPETQRGWVTLFKATKPHWHSTQVAGMQSPRSWHPGLGSHGRPCGEILPTVLFPQLEEHGP